MPLFNMHELRRALPPGGRLIGLDHGTKIIGVALSDVGLTIASPYGDLRRGKLARNAAEIRAIAKKEGAGGIVIGLPLSMDGSAGRAAQAVRDWAHAISAATGLPVALFDERLTTDAVNRLLIEEADLGRKRRAEVVDRMAAARILQAALDATE
jgi:putative holliday junction resolvase